jgi:lysophospholipase L1-like esterase
MFRSRRWLLVLAISLVLSLVGNGILAWLVREQYRGMVRVRLDPSSEVRFTKLNAELPPLKHGEKRIVFVGASRIDMWSNLPTVSGCQMVNRGQSHNTSAQLKLRLDRDVIALKPDIVYLEIGVNDLKSIGVIPDEERTIIDRLKANRKIIIDRLTEAGIEVIVSTIYPFGDVSLTRRPVWSDRILQAREEINREIRLLNRPLVTVFDADPIFAVEGRMKAEYQLDELHLNDAGYDALNRALVPVIEKNARK